MSMLAYLLGLAGVQQKDIVTSNTLRVYTFSVAQEAIN